MKIIKVTKCFEECPNCTGPDYNRDKDTWQFTCQEIPAWIEDVDTIPDWCPLTDASQQANTADNEEI